MWKTKIIIRKPQQCLDLIISERMEVEIEGHLHFAGVSLLKGPLHSHYSNQGFMGLCGRGMAVAKRHRYIYLFDLSASISNSSSRFDRSWEFSNENNTCIFFSCLVVRMGWQSLQIVRMRARVFEYKRNDE